MILALSACTSVRTIEPQITPISLKESIKKDDSILIKTFNNTRFEMIVVKVTKSHIIGKLHQVKISDIKQVQIREISAAKTTGAIVGGYLATIATVLLFVLLIY